MTGSTLALEMLAWFQLMALILGFVAACAYLGERNSQIDQNSRAIGKLTSAVDDLVKAQADMSASIAGSQRAVEGVIRRLDDVVRRLEARDDASLRPTRRLHDDGRAVACDAEVR